jgi:serine/threonine protein kinase
LHCVSQGQSNTEDRPRAAIEERCGSETTADGISEPAVEAASALLTHKGENPEGRPSKTSLLEVSEPVEDSDAEPRDSPDILAERFPPPESVGLKRLSNEVVGRGNYGYVVKGTVDLSVPVETGHPGMEDGSAASSNARIVAIKVTPVRAYWSTDEIAHLQHITGRVRVAQDMMLTANSLSPMGNRRVALEGSSRVVTLQGECCYDRPTDSLWIPLTWMPHSLEQCIANRVETTPPGDLVFSVKELQHAARQLLQALHFLAVECGLCHLDTKPANILLSHSWRVPVRPHPGSDEASTTTSSSTDSIGSAALDNGANFPDLYLCDFGLAQRISTPILQLGDFLFMPPEIYWAKYDGEDGQPQLSEKVETFRSTHDVWSVGATVLNMMEGMAAFTAGAGELFAFFEGNFVSPAPRNSTCWPMELNDFLLKCFERDVSKRPTPLQMLHHPFFQYDEETVGFPPLAH